MITADIDPDRPNHITLNNVPFNMKDTCNKVPGLLWDRKGQGNTWRMSLGWASYLALINTFKQSLVVGPELMAWVERETNERINPSLYWKTQTDAPGLDGLYPFQKVGVQFMATAKRVLCCDDMGLGKTRETIATLAQHYANGKNPFPCLVVAPNSTKQSWKREFETVWPGIKVTVIEGSAAQRKKQFKEVTGTYPCPVHHAVPTENTTLSECVETATNETCVNAIQSSQSDNETTTASGLSPTATTNGLEEQGTSEQNMDSLSKSTTNTLNNLNTDVSSAQAKQSFSTTDTQMERFAEPSAEDVISASRKQKTTSRGLKEPACTCPTSHVAVINWDALRSHSRLAPYGNVALAKCEEHGGKNPKITPAKCHVHLGELNHIDFKSVIADEVHKAKDGKSQQTRALKYATGDADIRIGLTGTPIANSLVDLWSILNWLSPEEWPSKTSYIDRFVELSYDQWGYETVIGFQPGVREEFFQAFDPRMIRRTKESVLDQLPPVTYERRDVAMSPKQKKAYTQMQDLMMAELDEESDNLVVTNGMVKIGRLLQFASSYAEAEVEPYIDEVTGQTKYHTKVTLINPSNKVDAFMNDIDDFAGRQVVVFAASRQLIELLSAQLTKKGHEHGLITGKIDLDERQVYIDRFQRNEFQFMLVTTGAGGTGLTLTAANTAVFLQRPWSVVDSQQSEARVHRIGSEIHDKITVIDYVSTGTADEIVLDALQRKDNMLQIILRDKDKFRKDFLS